MAQRRSTARKPRSSGASRRSAGSRKKSNGLPGWVWLVTGLLTGLFIAFLVVLHKFGGTSPTPSAQQAQGKSANVRKETRSGDKKGGVAPSPSVAHKQQSGSAPTTKEATTSAANKQHAANTPERSSINYDFYKILPQSEVVIPEDELHKPANTALATTPGTYYLQVGAFRRIEEADSRKAELAMLGIVTSIQTVTLEPNNSWHRVRVGPVKDLRQLDRTKRQLQENNIAFVTIKEKN
jgi:cell division protein FtsN